MRKRSGFAVKGIAVLVFAALTVGLLPAMAFAGQQSEDVESTSTVAASLTTSASRAKSTRANRQAFLKGKLTGPIQRGYTGKLVRPTVKLVVKGKTLKRGVDYKLFYKNNRKVGRATITIKGIGKYKGAKRTWKFTIVPDKTKLKSAKAQVIGKKIVIKWSKQPKANCTGYQIRYSTKKSMAKAKLKTIKKRKKTSYTIKGLKANKRYYVQVRVYKRVNGKTYYSRWSNKKTVKMPKYGSLTGVVTAYATGSYLPNAKVGVYNSKGKRICTIKTNRNGRYTIKNIAKGTYTLKIKRSGYIALKAKISVRNKEYTYCDRALLVKRSAGSGYASGSITSATTGYGVSGAKLVFRSGWNNKSGNVVGRCTTGSGGTYYVNLPAGYYTAKVTCNGYVVGYINVIIGGGTIYNQNGSITPKMPKDTYRAVLTWGEYPRDLDSHLVQKGLHVYFSNKNQGSSVANLDVDDTTSYGPETTTFKVKKSRTYIYYVEQYTNDGKLSKSGAKVKLYRGNKLIRSYSVKNKGNGRSWNVFKIVNGKVKTVQTLSNYPTSVSTKNGNMGRPSW